jgi:hypothetical protein
VRCGFPLLRTKGEKEMERDGVGPVCFCCAHQIEVRFTEKPRG